MHIKSDYVPEREVLDESLFLPPHAKNMHSGRLSLSCTEKLEFQKQWELKKINNVYLYQ